MGTKSHFSPGAFSFLRHITSKKAFEEKSSFLPGLACLEKRKFFCLRKPLIRVEERRGMD
ncbi:MAG: hypothetical protein C5B47_06505 [Verrucomicrobia bacterium]|nr:MAG: hypothetical protein C5B47_06505 [Verrucomicrobiota bacterium]